MKKILTALALATLALTASATTLVVEYDYNNVAGSPNGYSRNQYGYIGIAQPLGTDGKYGVGDVGIQAAGASIKGFGTDNQTGWEVGYTYPLSFGKITVLPRLATGAMNNINGGGGVTLNARYWLASVEANTPLTAKLGGYVSVSHMNGINADSIARANRLQVGVDYAATKTLSLRAGYSYTKFAADNLNGVVLMANYSF